MPSYPLRALVLRKTKLGETDTILTLLADDGGQVRAVAKGLRKPGGRFGARLEPYAVCDLLLHTGRSLEVVTEAQTVASHSGLREDLDRSAAAAVVADLLDKIVGRGAGGAAALRACDDDARRDGDRAASSAAGARDRVPGQGDGDARLPAAARGVRVLRGRDARQPRVLGVARRRACVRQCGALDAATLRFGPEGRAWLDGSARREDWPTSRALEMPPAAVADCFELVRAFVTFHVPARLRALDYYAGTLPSG